ncbi:MAG TPA: DsbA family protein [Rubrivivax sp.]|nr:DsbA family protein [Rubrivivax sp.]
MIRPIDFYFFVGSTYSYLSVARAGALAAAHGVPLVWRPFSVRTLMREQNNSPFVGKPAKFAYMWRDLQRRARRFGIPFDGAPPYPIDAREQANHVATLAASEGWCEDFVREAYRSWFLDKLDPGSPPVLAAILQRLGRPADCIERAERAEVLSLYTAQTDRARALGIFGSPTWVCADQEIFWGDDRLEDAIDWCRP